MTHRKVLLKLLTLLVTLAALTACSDAGAPHAEPLRLQGTSDNLFYALTPDRANPQPLDGATISGQIYIWLEPDAPPERVKFYLNDSYERTEMFAPYALAGDDSGVLEPYDTAELAPGRHKLVSSGKVGADFVKRRAYFMVAPTQLSFHPAKRARDFVDTIGINTHLHYTDRVYYQRYEDLIKPKLLELGVRHVRDGAHTYEGVSGETFFYKRLRELGQAGIRFTLITKMNTPHSETTDFSKLDDIVAWSGGAVEAFEGVNEPDLQKVSDWADQATQVQKELYATVQENEALEGIDVLGPSPVREQGRLGDLSDYLDYGNAHPYPGGKMPTGSERGQSTRQTLADAAQNSGDGPVIVTETGYHNALETTADHPPTSEAATAKYLPRLLLEHFNSGVPRTYLYELIDGTAKGRLNDKEASFGLLRNDGSEKPAFRALRNLIALVDDAATDFEPGALEFSLAGDTNGVHYTLLQKSDGTFYLALWLEKPSWDRDTRKATNVPEQEVTVKLGSPPDGATLYELDGTGRMTESSVPLKDTVELNVTDSVRVLELCP